MEIKLKKAEIKKAIAENFGGGVGAYGPAHYLIVRPNGSHRIAVCERQCWQDDDYVAAIPAPYGDGSGELGELADEMLKVEGLEPAGDEGSVAAAERLAPDSWQEWQDEALDWYANEFLRALNGEQNDLAIDAPFGALEVFEPEHNIEVVECPFSFEWAVAEQGPDAVQVEDQAEKHLSAAGFQDWDVWYTETAQFIAAQAGGHPSNVEDWLRDGDAEPGEEDELVQEWRSIGCEYEFNQ